MQAGNPFVTVQAGARLCACLCVCVRGAQLHAQENPLDNAHTPTKPAEPAKPKGEVLEGRDVTAKGASHPMATLRVDANLVLVPMTVTDTQNRLVTGLERENFYVYENNQPQTITQLQHGRRARDDRHHLRSCAAA